MVKKINDWEWEEATISMKLRDGTEYEVPFIEFVEALHLHGL